MKKIIILLLISFIGYSQKSGTVKYVQDGDSFGMLIGGVFADVRLINADAPEIANKKYGKEAQPFGDITKEIVKNYIDKKKVKVKLYGTDKYGRTLAEVWVREGLKQRALSYVLVKNGLAWVNEEYITNVKLKRILLSKQAYAKKNKMGLWADSTAIAPSEWRKR